LTGKQNTLEGHIVKVVAQLYQKDQPIPFTDIWDSLVVDLEAKLDDKRPNKMDTPEFGEITKQRVGYRLHEVLGGNKRSYRSKEGFTKAYEFSDEKLRRTIKSYGFNIVSKCLSFPTSEGVFASEIMEKDHEISMPKPVDTPLEVGKLGHTDTMLPVATIENVLAWLRLEFQQGHNPIREGPKPLEPIDKGKCQLCQQFGNLPWQVQFDDGSRIDACCLSCGGKINDLVGEFRAKLEEVTS
jgi:hypothetical protein